MAVVEVVFGNSPLYSDNIQFRSGTAFIMTLDHAITAARTLTLPDVTDTVAVLGTAQTWTTLQTFNAGIIVHPTAAVTANSQSLNPAPTALVLTAANTKSFTAIAQNITLPSITPAANGAGITLTGLNLSQGAISNVADSEAITVKQLIITGAAGAALATGVYSWTGADITMPAQAANAAINLAKGIKITGGALAGGASATQIGLDITMAAATDRAINVVTGQLYIAGNPLATSNLVFYELDSTRFTIANTVGGAYKGLVVSTIFAETSLTVGTTGLRGYNSNQATLPINITTITDAGTHDINLQIDDKTYLQVRATGDGAGDVTTPIVTAYTALNSMTLAAATTAASQMIGAAPTAIALTAANTKSFTGTAQNIVLPAITPAANGSGITLTGLNLSQGAIANVADTETITVTQLAITGAAGAALETGVYSFTGISITTPAQAANGAANIATGLKITGGTQSASGTQTGVNITMAVTTHKAIFIPTGTLAFESGRQTIGSDGSYGLAFSSTNASGGSTARISFAGEAITARMTFAGVGISHTFIAATTANDDSINPAPSATTLTAANAKSFTGVAHHIVLPAITPAANGSGITLTGLNLSQGAIANAADTETITVTQLAITGAAGAALDTGIYSWTGISITTPAQAANAAVNAAVGLKVTCGAVAGDAAAYQRGVEITMAVNTQPGLVVLVGNASIGVAPYATLPANALGVAGGLMIGANSLNNLIDDASGGAGSTAMYIGNAQITVASDIRIKTNITPTVFKAVDRLNSLRVIDFEWDDPTDRNLFGKNSRGRWTGISAQEMIKVAPWVINAEGRNCPKCLAGETCTKHGMMFVEYDQLVPVLVKAVQELSEEVRTLRKN